MSGIRRQVGTDQLRRAAPLELEPLELVLAPIDTATLAGQRDRALLLLGFAAALRRSELVALDVEDLEFDTARGLKLTIRKSKTDQEQAGAQVAVPYARETDRCAVRALSQWLQAAKIHRGPGVSPDALRRDCRHLNSAPAPTARHGRAHGFRRSIALPPSCRMWPRRL